MQLLLKKVRRRQQRSKSSSKLAVKAPDKRANGHHQSPPPSSGNLSEAASVPVTSTLTNPPNTSNEATPLPIEPSTSENQRGVSEPPSDLNPERNGSRDLRLSSAGSRAGGLSWLLYWAALAQGWWHRGWQKGHQKWRQVTEDGGGWALLTALAAGVFLYAIIKERAALKR